MLMNFRRGSGWLTAIMLIVGLGLAVDATAPDARAQSSGIDTADRAAIEEIVRQYILDNPDVVIDALAIAQQRQEQEELERRRLEVVARHDQIFNSSSPVMGNPDGDVTLVEFFDYQCTYCKRVLDTVFEAVDGDPGLRVVFKDLPILGPESIVAARASLAARRQGLYVEYHNTLMAFRGRLSEEVIFQVARDVGLDVDRLRRDMEAPEIAEEIRANLLLADSVGIRGTPAFIIGDEVVPGAVSLQTLQGLIERDRSS